MALRFVLILLMAALTGCGKVNLAPIGGGAMGQSLTPEQRFVLKSTDGSVVDLSQVLAQKKLVLINFWATWCTYCVEEMPELIKLQEAHAAKGFTVLAVNVGETSTQADAFAKAKGLNFPVVLDEDSSVAQRYGLVGIPVSILVDSAGNVLGEYHGFNPKLISDVEKALDSGA